jgi:hypothetical protein
VSMNITYRVLPALSFLYYQLHIVIVISHHLLSTNHKCTQHCPTAAQKRKKNWSILIENCFRGERLPPVDCLWCFGVYPLLYLQDFFISLLQEIIRVINTIYL